MKHLHRFMSCDKGTAAIEFALIGLLLFTVTIAIIEAGRVLFMINEISHVADRASRVVLLNFNVAESELVDVVRDKSRLAGLVSADITLASPEPPVSATFRNVAVSYPFSPILSGFGVDAVTLSTDRQVAR